MIIIGTAYSKQEVDEIKQVAIVSVVANNARNLGGAAYETK